MGQDGVNWAQQFPLYQRILNNDPKEVIACKTFEIYIARKCNAFRENMRKEIVEYLKSNPYNSDGFPLLENLADDDFACWDDYITHMARDGTYRDQITLYAAA